MRCDRQPAISKHIAGIWGASIPEFHPTMRPNITRRDRGANPTEIQLKRVWIYTRDGLSTREDGVKVIIMHEKYGHRQK